MHKVLAAYYCRVSSIPMVHGTRSYCGDRDDDVSALCDAIRFICAGSDAGQGSRARRGARGGAPDARIRAGRGPTSEALTCHVIVSFRKCDRSHSFERAQSAPGGGRTRGPPQAASASAPGTTMVLMKRVLYSAFLSRPAPRAGGAGGSSLTLRFMAALRDRKARRT
eukprot:COSAG06_NODE_32414_length_506_cov_1.336609_1_plen_166_part_10